MKQFLLAITLQSVAFLTFAQGSLPLYEYIEDNNQTPWFSHSVSTGGQHFDSWTMSSGYHYPVLKNINVYLATEMTTESDYNASAKGVLSGLEFNFSDSLSFGSSIQAERVNEETVGSVGMSSQFRLTEKLNLEAKFDYSLNQEPAASANYQLGVGYRF
ncbi:hypothetical protein LRP50_13565 [Enterovibrio sp. ZSDZ42]|uniref:Outer membrane protein beta-barrel domain-containing protein n=1 Tax=Enterovibrio gelatinilyticus TaxID=2899819 RepID=A0ABT5R1L0_9GAMM|nr:hypothetical protein [Enterovibrio sp. ZSDZ42]MDD1794164.1 hypothetical protein [Enterovibrio sp. ZSDZ42]